MKRWQLAVGAVVVAALIAAAFVAGRSGSTTTPTTSPVTVSTSPSLSPDPEGLPISDVPAGAGGTTQGPHGLPTGYPQTEQGAAAAATNYLTALFSSKVRSADYRQQVTVVMGDTPETQASLLDVTDRLAQIYGSTGPSVDIHAARGAWATVSYAPDLARIALWIPDCIPSRCTWYIYTVPLVWVDDDWKASSGDLIVGGPLGDAPTPVDPMGAPSSAEKRTLLSDRKLLGPCPADAPAWCLGDAWQLPWMEYSNAER